MRQAFEWDEDKAKANLRKHKMGFGEAATVFHDPFIANMLDPDHSYGEQRFIALGRSARGRLLVVLCGTRRQYSDHQLSKGDIGRTAGLFR